MGLKPRTRRNPIEAWKERCRAPAAMPMDVGSILEYIAGAADLYATPGYRFWGDNDAPGAAARLRCYASAAKWLIVGERLYYDRDQWGQHRAFVRSINSYGNGARQLRQVFDSVVSDADAPLFVFELDDDGEPTASEINPIANSVRIRDTTVAIPRDPQFLAGHSILGDPSKESLLYRALCSVPESRELLLSTGEEVRTALSVNDELSEILVLDDWAAPEDPESFAQSECARLLAEVIVHRDATRYRPTQPPNMHWRHHLTQV